MAQAVRESIDTTTLQSNGKRGEPTKNAFEKVEHNLTALWALLTDAAVALASVAPAADRLPYFTGQTTAGLASLTAFGRSLIDDANAAAALQTLGLGTPSTLGKNILTAADAQAARALIGLVINGTGNWVDKVAYIAGNGITDLCTAIDFHASGVETDDYTNRLIGTSLAGLYLQRKGDANGRMMFDQSNILGNVGMNGGIPGGAIFQYIAGGDGQSFALRLADGTQFCWGTSAETLTASGAYGAGYISSPSYTAYPAGFSGVPRVFYVTQNHTNAPSMIMGDTTPTASSCSTRIFGFVQNAAAKYGYFAIGRWV